MTGWMFRPCHLPWNFYPIATAALLTVWLLPLASLARKSVRIADYCRRNGLDEVDFIFAASHPLAVGWWRSLLAWIGLTVLWTVV